MNRGRGRTSVVLVALPALAVSACDGIAGVRELRLSASGPTAEECAGIDLSSDLNHCGACNAVCQGDCVDGRCLNLFTLDEDGPVVALSTANGFLYYGVGGPNGYVRRRVEGTAGLAHYTTELKRARLLGLNVLYSRGLFTFGWLEELPASQDLEWAHFPRALGQGSRPMTPEFEKRDGSPKVVADWCFSQPCAPGDIPGSRPLGHFRAVRAAGRRLCFITEHPTLSSGPSVGVPPTPEERDEATTVTCAYFHNTEATERPFAITSPQTIPRARVVLSETGDLRNFELSATAVYVGTDRGLVSCEDILCDESRLEPLGEPVIDLVFVDDVSPRALWLLTASGRVVSTARAGFDATVPPGHREVLRLEGARRLFRFGSRTYFVVSKENQDEIFILRSESDTPQRVARPRFPVTELYEIPGYLYWGEAGPGSAGRLVLAFAPP